MPSVSSSFNDVFSRYGVHTSIFDNMHVTAAFATSEPDSIERIMKRAGKSFSDPRLLFGRGHRSRSQHEVERYVLGEQDGRGLHGDRQFLFVNAARPFIAGKLRHFAEPRLKRLARDFFHGERAAFVQTRKTLDTPGTPEIDWIGVRAAVAYAAPLRTAPLGQAETDMPSLSVLDLNHGID